MSKKVILITLVLFPFNLFCQSTQFFSLKNWLSEFDLNIYLFDDNTYYLSADQSLLIDISHELVLGYGTYQRFKNSIVFTDTLFEYQFEADNIASTLVFTRAPLFIKNKLLDYCPDMDSIEKDFITIGIDKSITKNNIDKKLRGIKNSVKSISCFKTGNYFDSDHFELYFMDNGNYRYSFFDNLISHGKWKVEGLTITLADMIFKQNFYLIQDKNNYLRVIRLPFVSTNSHNIFKIQDDND